ncbi:MAG: alkane 1-monooxygenase [Sulfitobacter sp.]|jgi:alkane 1-monooxygenase
MSTTNFTPSSELGRLRAALPYAISFAVVPVLIWTALNGGWWLLLPPVFTWALLTALDAALGLNDENLDPNTGEAELFWYRAIVIGWVPVAILTTMWLVWYVPEAAHLAWWEKLGVFFGAGIMNGTIGIVYAHELMHQKNRLERWAADILMALTMYGHFRSEHLLVHHRYVATPRDAVTARYNENFHRFFLRVVPEGIHSAWKAEAQMLARKNLSPWNRSNPHWRYWGLQLGFGVVSFLLGGFWGLALWLYQASVAIWQLELVDFVEHYALTRKHLGDGKYEHVLPRHSWNASHKASNWLLINLQRHSDHHYKPDRRYPLLQNYTEAEAPALPYGYPVMTAAALFPPIWFRMMNPRVRKWRAMYYPEITDWGPYKRSELPMPRGAS